MTKKTLESSSFQTFHPHRVLLTHFISLKPPSHLQVIIIMSSPVLIQLHWPQEPVQFPHMVSVLPTPGRRRYSGGEIPLRLRFPGGENGEAFLEVASDHPMMGVGESLWFVSWYHCDRDAEMPNWYNYGDLWFDKSYYWGYKTDV